MSIRYSAFFVVAVFSGCLRVQSAVPSSVPASVSTLPPTCLGDLASLRAGDRHQHCRPNKFIEISFVLKFGCVPRDSQDTTIDHGVRLEVGIRSGTSRNWQPIRFYTTSITAPTYDNSLVQLAPSNTAVVAQALLYNSSLPLKLVDATRSLSLKEYLCGDYVDILRSNSLDLRLRWMQRFGTQAGRNFALWIIDDVKIKLWNGSCFSELVSKNFSSDADIEGLDLDVRSGTIKTCGSSDVNEALHFSDAVTSDLTRRSITINVSDQSSRCEEESQVNLGLNNSSCPVEENSSTTSVNITCSAGGAVRCSCNQGGGAVINNTKCQMIPTTLQPTTMATTTMATTTMATTTIATTQEPTTLLPMNTQVLQGESSAVEFISNVLDNFPQGGVPKEVTMAVVNATTNSLRAASEMSDPGAGGRILKSLDLFALQGYNSSFGKVSNDLYSFVVEDYEEKELGELEADEYIEGIEEEQGDIRLPVELFRKMTSSSKNIRVASFVYNNLSGILPAETESGEISSMGSPVISATLRCGRGACFTSNVSLSSPVVIELKHFKALDSSKEALCQFFDLERNVWSTSGCRRNTTRSNDTYSVCECVHLTHFAILLSPKLDIPESHTLSLEIIGYVGVSISIICMVLTVLVLTFLKPLRGMRTYIHVNLCVSLGLAQLLFVVAVDKTSIKEVCQTVAIVLHYLFLVAFMWMLMEGVVLYVVLVRVFIKREKLYMLAFTLVSYGLPAFYLLLTVPLGLVLKGGDNNTFYGPSEDVDACWLRYDTHFVWAIIAPVVVIILINCGFFVMAISIMCKHQKRGTDKSKFEVVSNWLKTSISLMVVMGITWLIGVLVFHQALLFVAYIFTIVTAFQGAIIFLLFVVFSKQVRDHYGSWWKSKKSESEILSKLFPSTPQPSRFSRTGTKTSSFFSRGMTLRSLLPDNDDVKLQDVKKASSSKWSCVVDMKSSSLPCGDSEMRVGEDEVKKQDLAGDLKVPVGNLDLSYSFGSRNSSIAPEARDSKYFSVEPDGEVTTASSVIRETNDLPEGPSHDEKVIGRKGHTTSSDSGCSNYATDDESGSSDHVTSGGSGKSNTKCKTSMEDIGIHLADTS